MPAFSVTIISHNEAGQIGEAIASVSWADEVVVVDSGSTDGTPAIAAAQGARVESRDWPGYAAQKNYAATICRNDWIFSLDADERVSPGLGDALRAWQATAPAAAGYRVARASWYLGRWIRTTDWYPDWQLRLYDRRAGSWRQARVHESVQIDGIPGRLAGEILHYPYADVSEHVCRIDRYASLAALELRDRGRSASPAAIVSYPVFAFLRNYILRGGIRDGRAGLAVSLLNSYYVLLKFVKLLELERQSDR